MKLSGWGCYPVIETNVVAPRNDDEVINLIKNGNTIARGNGRAYGDCAVSNTNTIHMKHLNRLLAFDTDSGQLVAEAGVLLADVIETFLSRGWFPAVTPGTKFVTLGGMVAADVHGKNHHKDGSFGNYVDWIDVLTANHSIQRCSRTTNPELFAWTIGGMGLTGIILRIAMRLRPVSSAWIEQRTIAADNITHAIELFEQSKDSTYSVAWIDCLQTGSKLGRSLVILGEHAEAANVPVQSHNEPLHTFPKRKWSIPIKFPNWALNTHSIRTFNFLYYWNGKRKPEHQLIDWDSYFYPLDKLLGWNKIYGSRGFAQFQCVIPLKHAEKGLRELLEAIADAGLGSFLAVLKRFGAQESKFSFPMAGYTLALDFPVKKKTLDLMDELDSITLKYKGRFYLAKDSRMSPKVFQQSEHRISAYKKFRQSNGNLDLFASAQSERLGL
ncbi:FAD-binding oxidoreductase [Amylibacter sp.]|nr:FAD-binding oxidoreductase [Amylibacter sp.]